MACRHARARLLQLMTCRHACSKALLQLMTCRHAHQSLTLGMPERALPTKINLYYSLWHAGMPERARNCWGREQQRARTSQRGTCASHYLNRKPKPLPKPKAGTCASHYLNRKPKPKTAGALLLARWLCSMRIPLPKPSSQQLN
jgi:hypothetical protein